MFIKEVLDFFFTELALEHVFDGEVFGVLDKGEYLVEFGGFEDGVGLDDSDGIRKVLLFGVEQQGLLLKLGLGGSHWKVIMVMSKMLQMNYDRAILVLISNC